MKGLLLAFLFMLIFIFPDILHGQEKGNMVQIEFEQKLQYYIDNPIFYKPRRNILDQLNRDSVRNCIGSLKMLTDSLAIRDESRLQLSALYEMGFLYFMLDEGDSTISLMTKALKYIDKDQYPWEYAMVNALAAEACKRRGYLKRSNEYNLEILSVPEYYADTSRRAATLGFMAENYNSLLELEKSMECCRNSYDLFMAIDNYSHASYQLVLMSWLVRKMQNDTSFLEYLHMANELAGRTEDSARIANNLVNTGIGYLSIRDGTRALIFLLEGWKIDHDVYPHRDVYGACNIARAYLMLDSLEKAKYFAYRALNLSHAIHANTFIVQSNIVLSEYFKKVGKYDSARICLNEALTIEREAKKHVASPELYRMMSDMCLRMEDFEAAAQFLDTSYKYYRKLVYMNDHDKMSKNRAKFDYDLQKSRIQELKMWNHLEKEKNRRYVIIVITIMLILFLTIGFVWGLRQQLSKLRESNLNLVKKNLELDKVNARLKNLSRDAGKRKNQEHIQDEDRILEKLEVLLDKEKVYRDRELTLVKLAEISGTNTTYLSSIINNQYHLNFKSLIHKYRIDEARYLLVNGAIDSYSIDGIAREVGYRSRSVFYQVFKQFTGVTPTVYVENYRKALENKDHIKDYGNGFE